jgi:hypothetical protein
VGQRVGALEEIDVDGAKPTSKVRPEVIPLDW